MDLMLWVLWLLRLLLLLLAHYPLLVRLQRRHHLSVLRILVWVLLEDLDNLATTLVAYSLSRTIIFAPSSTDRLVGSEPFLQFLGCHVHQLVPFGYDFVCWFDHGRCNPWNKICVNCQTDTCHDKARGYERVYKVMTSVIISRDPRGVFSQRRQTH